MPRIKYRILDLFAGAGGFSLGFHRLEQDGYNPFETVGFVEIDRVAADTLVSTLINSGVSKSRAEEIVICGDITLPETKRRLYSVCPEVDIIIGGPPCQSFSLIGPRAGDAAKKAKFSLDERDSLFYHYLEIVSKYQPAVFVFENVTGLLSKKHQGSGRKYIDLIMEEFRDIGYSLKHGDIYEPSNGYMVLNAADYGVPQHRERVFIIGNRLNAVIRNPEKTHCPPDEHSQTGLLPYVTLWDAIGDLPPVMAKITYTLPEKRGADRAIPLSRKQSIDKLNSTRFSGIELMDYHWERFEKFYDEGDKSRKLFLDFIRPEKKGKHVSLIGHVARMQQETDIKLFREMQQGTSSKDLLSSSDPSAGCLLDLIKYDMKSFKDKYKKLSWSKPCGTIFAHLCKDGNRFIHPDSNQERTLTVREAARIQTFPDDFIFLAVGNMRFKYIGNAVPPLMASAIAKTVYETLKVCTKNVGRGHNIVSIPTPSRSKNMAAIKNRNTTPEVLLRKALFAAGLRFRLNKKILGSPDIVFWRKRIAIFVDGCFWHGCPDCYKKPMTNREFWREKVETNRRRDNEVVEKLRNDGWIVLRFWEHRILKDLDNVVREIVAVVRTEDQCFTQTSNN